MVILDCGHGHGSRNPAGSRSPDGRRTEAAIVREVAFRAAGILAQRGVTVRIVDSGPYEDRQRAPLVGLADLYLAIHVDAGQPSRTPYALALYLRGDYEGRARAFVADYTRPLGLRPEAGAIGPAPWGSRGVECLRYLPAHVPAWLVELGAIDNPAHDRLWTQAGLSLVADALAGAIVRALPAGVA